MPQPCWPVTCNPASFEECALRPTAGIWLVLEHALETAEVRGLVHDHLTFLVLWCPPWEGELCGATQNWLTGFHLTVMSFLRSCLQVLSNKR